MSLSVGGTTLPPDASGNPDRALEYAWSGGGGGISAYESEPAYQLGVRVHRIPHRTRPGLRRGSGHGGARLRHLAGECRLSGRAVDQGRRHQHWRPANLLVGGHRQSVARCRSAKARSMVPTNCCPPFIRLPRPTRTPSRTSPRAITATAAGPGYDFVTGLGTPNAQYLVPDLVAAFSSPAAPATLYWTGDAGDQNWDTPGNWSTVDPLVTNVQQSVLPTPNDNVVVDLQRRRPSCTIQPITKRSAASR